MLEKFVAALPTIGKIAGSLLTSMFGGDGNEDVYLSYDLTPDSRKDGHTGCEAVFTNQDGQIVVSNYGLDKTKELVVRFPKSELAEMDDCYIPAGGEVPLNKVIIDHTEMDDSQIELTAVEADGGKGDEDTVAPNITAYGFNIRCGGGPITVGGILDVDLSQRYLSVQSTTPPPFINGINSLDIGAAVTPANMASINLTGRLIQPSAQFISVSLPYALVAGTVYTVEITLNLRWGNSVNEARKRSLELTRPISERTRSIREKGRRVY